MFPGDAFSEMSQKSPELQEEFSYNSETQKALCKNGEVLLGEDMSWVSKKKRKKKRGWHWNFGENS